jgi:hypothetical protein
MAHDRRTLVPRGPQPGTSEIDALLRRLADKSPQEAPLSVRQHLRSIIQRHSSPERTVRERWLLPVAGIAAALLVVVLGVLAISAISNRHANSDRALIIPAASNHEPGSPVAINTQKPATAPPAQPAKLRRRHRSIPVGSPHSPFVALPFSDPTLANGTNVTIRLALSDAELLAFGVALDENKRGQLYVADIVLGDDGLPRAIRLLANLSAIQGGS